MRIILSGLIGAYVSFMALVFDWLGLATAVSVTGVALILAYFYRSS